MGLCHDLRNKCVVIEVFNVHHFPFNLQVFACCLVDISHQIFILQIKSEIFLEVIEALRVFWRWWQAKNRFFRTWRVIIEVLIVNNEAKGLHQQNFLSIPDSVS